MSRAGTWRSNIAGRRANTIDCRQWRPIWCAVGWRDCREWLRRRWRPRRPPRPFRSCSIVGFDPVELGLVASLEPAGGNLTGVSTLNVELGPKRLELLRELVPTATIIALLVNPTNPNAETLSRDMQAAARTLGLQLHVLHASTERDFDTAFATLVQLRAGALVIGTDAFFVSRSEQLAALTRSPRGARDLPVSRVRRGRRPDELRGQCYGRVSSGRRLHRPDSQGREAGRPAGPAVHEGRAHHQPQDRQGARPHGPADHC